MKVDLGTNVIMAALRTARYFQERAARADLDAFDRLLARAGNKPP